MSHITLVRHGQANSAARTEDEYDRLSPLGFQQAEWLGQHLDDNGQYHHRVYCGTLRRHVETATAMGVADDMVQDDRLNELQYFDLARLAQEQIGLAIPIDREGFVQHMPQVFAAWSEGRLENVPESFDHFESHVRLSSPRAGSSPTPCATRWN